MVTMLIDTGVRLAGKRIFAEVDSEDMMGRETVTALLRGLCELSPPQFLRRLVLPNNPGPAPPHVAADTPPGDKGS